MNNPIRLQYKWFAAAVLCLTVSFIGGCSYTVKKAYDPAYVENMVLLEQMVKSKKNISVLIFPFKDMRGYTDRPYFVGGFTGHSVYLEKQTLSEYAVMSLLEDLNFIGVKALKNEDKDVTFDDIQKRTKQTTKGIDYVLSVDIVEFSFKAIINSGLQVESTYKYNVRIWDNNKSIIAFEGPLSKKIVGRETDGATFLGMADELLNENLSAFNADIALKLMDL